MRFYDIINVSDVREVFMIDLKREVADMISSSVENIDNSMVYELLEFPPDEKLGDVSLPCFKLSKIMRKAPPAIANEIASAVNVSGTVFERAEVVGGYLNFFISHDAFAKNVVEDVNNNENYGSSDIGNGKTVVLDYSSPNIAKPFHIGHLPSTVLGNSLYRIYSYLGYKAVGVNHLGDWGTQFGTMIVAYKKWGNKEEVEKGGVKELVRLYVKFHQEEENDPSLRDEARAWFAALENGNKEAYELWSWFKDVSLNECKRVYEILGVKFDYYTGESFYNDKMDSVVNELCEKGLLVESEGAKVVDLSEYNMPPCIILKSDGSTIYATRDLAAAFYRKNTFDFDKCIYLTATQQNLHFKQWFKVVELMGYDWAKNLIHAPFGMISLASGESMSTRKGITIWLEDVLSQATAKTLEIIKEKNPDMENKEEIARQMGVGAVMFSSLSTSRIKDVTFSWEDALNFDGETGPYVQYTHARACSVLRKADNVTGVISKITEDSEYKVIRTLYDFPAKIMLAMENNEPSVITRYIIDLSQDFNRFYHDCQINTNDEEIKQTRLAITSAVKKVLCKGLWLIGLEAPERV